jgi:hypothetical protein
MAERCFIVADPGLGRFTSTDILDMELTYVRTPNDPRSLVLDACLWYTFFIHDP